MGPGPVGREDAALDRQITLLLRKCDANAAHERDGGEPTRRNPGRRDLRERLRGGAIGVQWAGSRSTLYTLSAATEWLGGAPGFGLLALHYHGAELSDLTIPAAAPAARWAATIVPGSPPAGSPSAFRSHLRG